MNNSISLPYTLKNEWCLLEEIGQGGTGTVYRGTKINDPNTTCAIKWIQYPIFVQPENINMEQEKVVIARTKKHLLEESALLSNMSSMNNYLMQQYDYFVMNETETSFDFLIVLELLEPLTNRMASIGFNYKEITQIIIDVCEGLKCLHSNGVVHGDIKPENLFFRENQCVIGDFGNIRCSNDYKPKAMTLRYAPPEWYNGKELSIQSDIYSLGMTLFYLLLPNKLKEKMESHTVVDYLSMVPECFRKILKRACSYHEKDRYQMVDDMLRDLQNCLSLADESQKVKIEDYAEEKTDLYNNTVFDFDDNNLNVTRAIRNTIFFSEKTGESIRKDSRGSSTLNKKVSKRKNGSYKKSTKTESLPHFYDWLFFTVCIGLVPTTSYFLCHLLVKNTVVNQSIYIHELIFFAVVVSINTIKDLLFGTTRKKHPVHFWYMLFFSTISLIITLVVFTLIIVGETVSQISLQNDILFRISICFCLGSGIMGAVVAKWEDAND